MAASIGVCVVVMDQESVLLTLREDFPVWCLPGGGVEPKESLAQAALREVREETGLEIRLLGLVGLYFREQGGAGNHQALFRAEACGGQARADRVETLEVGWFPIKSLPDRLLGYHRLYLQDALREGPAVMRSLKIWPSFAHLTRKEIYRLRDEGKLDLEQGLAELCATVEAENIEDELG